MSPGIVEAPSRGGSTQRELWLDLLFDLSTDETTVGASRHILYVGRKRREPDQ